MDEATQRSRTAFVAWVTVGFGIVDLIRLTAEALVLREHGVYVWVLLLDVLIGLFVVIAGAALIKARPWGRRAVLAAWGALAANSVTFGRFLLPKYLEHLSDGEFTTSLFAITPRMLFYVAVLSMLPYILWRAWEVAKGEEHGRNVFLGWLVTAAGASALLSISILANRD